MKYPFGCLTPVFRLRWPSAVIKLSVLFSCAAGAVFGDVRQPCPPLVIEQACRADGSVQMTVRAGAKAPADLSYIVSLQGADQGAARLLPGSSLALEVSRPQGQQMTLAVVGLEPDGDQMATCCLSNQRVHVLQSCGLAVEGPREEAGDYPAGDLAIDLTLDPVCTRQGPAPVCSGEIAVAGPDAGAVQVTLSAEMGRQLVAAGAECTGFAQGQSLCTLPVGRPLPFDMTFDAKAPRGPATLCAEIGIGADATSRTLALQSALARAGYAVGVVDGDLGPRTLAALDAFVADAGLPPLDGEISVKMLDLLEIGDFADADLANNRACAVANLPAPPLVCDARTTRASGAECACKFKGMTRVSAAACACPKGQRLGARGCEAARNGLGSTGGGATGGGSGGGPTDSGPACDAATTVLRNGVCECRSDAMTRVSDTACTVPELRFCPDGRPELPGIPCAPDEAACSRFNDVGECCDLLGPEDLSCR